MSSIVAVDEIAGSSARLKRWRLIRESVLRLFAARGFADVSIDDIALEADMSRRTFFNYFPTKTSVLFDPDPQEAIHLRDYLAATPAEQSLWEGLCAGLERYLRSEHAVVEARARILRDEPSLNGTHMLANASFEHALTAWLQERGLDPRRSGLMGAVALAVVRESFRQWDPRDGYTAMLSEVDRGWVLAGAGFADIGGRADRRE